MNAKQEIKPYDKITTAMEFNYSEQATIVASQPSRPRAGDLCPTCGSERLDYDGLLNLTCPKCGVAVSGCFT